MLNKLFVNYYNYINVFDKSKANVLFSHRFYDHKLKFAKKKLIKTQYLKVEFIYYQITNSNKSRNI